MNRYLYDWVDLHRLGIKFSPSTLARREAEGRFPKRVHPSQGRNIAWPAADVDAYLAALAETRETV